VARHLRDITQIALALRCKWQTVYAESGEGVMKKLMFNLPTFGFVVGTRAMLGVGIGLLLSERLPADRRRHIALTLISIGVATTVPALIAVRRGRAAATNAVAA
jgi:hypothetical protein